MTFPIQDTVFMMKDMVSFSPLPLLKFAAGKHTTLLPRVLAGHFCSHVCGDKGFMTVGGCQVLG